MKHRLFDEIVLTRDLPEHGLRAGDLGSIVHVYNANAFEVEFAMVSGIARAVLTLNAADIRKPAANELFSVRNSDLPAPR